MNLTPVRQNLRQFEDNYTVISAFLDKCLVRLYLTNFYNKHILNSVNQISVFLIHKTFFQNRHVSTI